MNFCLSNVLSNSTDEREKAAARAFVVVGHCCETGDIFSQVGVFVCGILRMCVIF